MKTQSKALKGQFKRYRNRFIITIFIILCFPLLFTELSLIELDTTNGKDIALTINGLIAPFVAIVAAGLTFLAFWVQYAANQKLNERVDRDRFETKFYEMLRIHRENISEIELAGKHKGKKAFVKMFEELRFIYATLKNLEDTDIEANLKGEETLIKIAYHHFFWGVNRFDDSCNNEMDKEYKSISKSLCKELAEIKNDAKELIDNDKSDNEYRIEYTFRSPENKELTRQLKSDFYPFDGHVSKLGHTFRHLFDMVKFVIENDELTGQEQYDYVKMIRGQLSNHEQAILYWNSIWTNKDVWWKYENDNHSYHILIDYGLIKNIPFNLTDQMGPHPKDYFKEKKKEHNITQQKNNWNFEWT